ncbi:MAG TPA: DUF3341 domain-containing protein [Acidobacteriota bacterium]|nr:DUF3341 domain-containing protein [Acidobacteriota bacterium]
MNKQSSSLYGLLAEFSGPDELLSAAERAYSLGYRKMDAYSPFPIHGLSEAVGFRKTVLPWIVFGGGLTGAIVGFLLQYWVSVIAYPLNVGGKPLNSWPAFIVVTFELTILFSALSAVVGMLVLNGLPMPYHPVFNVDKFKKASRDGFFLCIEAQDSQFDRIETRKFLESLNPSEISEVED